MKICSNNSGITLIKLIKRVVFTIIFILLIFFVINYTTVDQEFSKYVTMMDGLQKLMDEKYTDLYGKVAENADGHRNKEIFFMMASGRKIHDVNEVYIAGRVLDLGIISQKNIKGTIYFEITNRDVLDSLDKIGKYDDTQTYYITDQGEVFSLPGFDMHKKQNHRWYVNEDKYYFREEGLNVKK